MSKITDTNPHRIVKPTHTLIYWNGNLASGVAGATYVEVEQLLPSGPYRIADFVLPEQRSQLENLEHALERAFVAGKHAKAAEMRKVLGL